MTRPPRLGGQPGPVRRSTTVEKLPPAWLYVPRRLAVRPYRAGVDAEGVCRVPPG